MRPRTAGRFPFTLAAEIGDVWIHVPRPHVFPAVFLGAVATFAFAWSLHTPPVDHHGEAREGLVVQAIVDHGEWILPRRNGELPSKPPLFHWVAGGAALAFGLSDVVLRLPSAVAAWGVACLTFALASTVGGTATAWLSVGVLFGMVPFLTSAIEARVDMVLTACTTAAFTAFFFWYRSRSPYARAFLYAAVSLAVLAKGPVGAVLPGMAILLFLGIQRDLQSLRPLWSWPSFFIAALFDLGWYALATAAGGRDFIALQVVRENWSRFVGDAEFQRTARGHTLRLPMLLVTQFLPWTATLAWAVVQRFRGARADVAERFLHVWWMVVLALFTVGAGKRPAYLLPAAPAIAVLAGRALASVTSGATGPRRAAACSSQRIGLAQILAVIAIFDVGALTTVQLVREHKARRHSLAAFVERVRDIVPGDGALPADPSMRASDRMVLAYRLRRSVRQQASHAPGLPFVVPATGRLEKWCEGATLLAESGGAADDFALMRSPEGVAARRRDAACTDVASVRGVAEPTVQAVAGLLGAPDPNPTQTPGRPDAL